MAKDKTRTLFFIAGPSPTDEQRAEAAAMSGIVCFRNSNYAAPEDGVEPFDKLAGEPPAHYLAAAGAMKALNRVVEGPKVDSEAADSLARQGRAASPPTPNAGWAPNT